MMAGFEVVVRPVIFPDIRPRAKQSLPPQDDPEKGLAVISGNPAQAIGLSYSWSASASYSQPREKSRRVDEVRVYQKGGDGGDGGGGGGGDEGNYIDMEVANRITMTEPGGQGGNVPGAGGGGSEQDTQDFLELDRAYYYQRVQETDNIVVLARDKIRKAPR